MNLREKYGIPSNAVITIAGTVGVGKSTMTKALATSLDAIVKGGGSMSMEKQAIKEHSTRLMFEVEF